MSPTQVQPRLLAWGADGMDEGTILQAAKASRLPFIAGHVALMPDAHIGLGATVGSVIPTEGAIIPAAVGVDIGCGMIASETSLSAADLPDDLSSLLRDIEHGVPAGVGKGHAAGDLDPRNLKLYDGLGVLHTELTAKQEVTAACQFGTLGSGNHFAEVCLDERDRVWTVLHSGSRGIGNQLASKHIATAKGVMRQYMIGLEDPDLAYFAEGTPEFTAYITDMTWAQFYALGSRQVMAGTMNRALFAACGRGRVTRTVNCHHNFTEREWHGGKQIWVTRKGAIRAGVGDPGVIPGSMGTSTYIVTGLGSHASYNSCSHGAGRKMSRSAARRDLTPASLTEVMGDRTWNADRASALVDEHPGAYKDIEAVMAAQADLCTVEHVLHQVLNYKG